MCTKHNWALLPDKVCAEPTLDYVQIMFESGNALQCVLQCVFAIQTHVIFRTPQQEHSFGHPVQLGHHDAADRPQDAMLETFQVFPGDIIVMGSDGIFDNLSEGEILRVVKAFDPHRRNPLLLVRRLVHLAYDNSLNKWKGTPFSWAATEAFDMVYSGGKPDDISVVVAYLLE